VGKHHLSSKAILTTCCIITTSSTIVQAEIIEPFLNIGIDAGITKGGIKSGSATRLYGDLGLTVDLSNLTALNNSEVVISYMMFRGEMIDEFTGAFQATGGNDSDEFSRWYDITFSSDITDKLAIKFGQMDVDSHFMSPENAGDFVQSAFSYSPTIEGLPTYPLPTIGGLASYSFSDLLTVSVGHFDAGSDRNAFDENFSVLETNWSVSSETTIAVGLYSHSGVEGGSSRTDLYAFVDHQFTESLQAFIQLGQGSHQHAPLTHHFSAGISQQAVLFDIDTMGLSYTQAKINGLGTERVIELFQKYQINDSIYLQLDFQWVNNPSGDQLINDAKVANFRVAIEL